MLTFSVNKARQAVSMDIAFIRNSSSNGSVGEANDSRREWLSTLYLNICDGRADQNTDISAYAAVCRQRELLSIADRETPIITGQDMEDGVKGVSEDALGYIESAFEDLESASRFYSSWKEFVDFADYVEIEDDVDLAQTVLSALEGNKISVRLLAGLVNKYDKLKELVCTLLSVEGCFRELALRQQGV